MSLRIAAVCLLLAPFTHAAPVPKVETLTREREVEFGKLVSSVTRNEVIQTAVYCRLVQHPDAAVEYLVRKLPVMELTERRAKQLIADLGSDDEKTWKAAFSELVIFDVRLAMSLGDAISLAETKNQQDRLGAILFGYVNPDEIPADLIRFDAEPCKILEHRWHITEWTGGRGGMNGHGIDVWIGVKDWTDYGGHETRKRVAAARLGVAVLERVKSPAAVGHLEALAKGHPDAEPTRSAVAAIARLKKGEAGQAPLAELWKREPEKFATTETVNQFLDRPADAVKLMKKALKPVTLSKSDAEKLLARLFDKEPKEWRAALSAIHYHDLRLAMPVEDLWTYAKTATHRGRLLTALTIRDDYSTPGAPDDFDLDISHKPYDYSLSATRWEGVSFVELYVVTELRKGVSEEQLTDDQKRLLKRWNSTPNTLHQFRRDKWPKEECAIYILDAIGTDDAIAVIKDMATGHADAGPTKAAKEVLKRRGVK